MKEIVLTAGQQSVFDSIVSFLEDESKDIFIFKGYAGTGKTFLITYLGEYLHKNQWEFYVMAPTGRAAKVLRDKFSNAVKKYGFCEELENKGVTIHSFIYSGNIECEESENPDVSEKSFRYFFPLKSDPMLSSNSVLIVDESSMIGDIPMNQEFLQFGSGCLLSDILEFKRSNNVGKIIFVGDDMQLPPVGDSESKALKESYFVEKGLGVCHGELTEIVRQDADSLILKNATAIRNILQLPRQQRNTFVLEEGEDVQEVEVADVTRQFVEKHGFPEIGTCAMIAFSNKQCHHYNQSIREILFKDNAKERFEDTSNLQLQPGDLLLNTKNSRGAFGRSLYNGDIFKVVNIGNTTSRTVPVRIKGEDSIRNVRLSFTEVMLMDDERKCFNANLLNNTLYAEDRDISIAETRALYIDFCMRMREQYPKLKEGSDEFKEILQKDVYFNALHVKFGYAVTCHKAQGGEWDTVWVDYSGRVNLSDDAMRWCYTATTRARRVLKVISPPQITPFQKLQFSPIQKASKAPKGFFSMVSLDDGATVPNAPVGLSLKIKGVKESLTNTPYHLQSADVFGYQVRFTFVLDSKTIVIENYFDGEGIIKRLLVTGDGTPRDNLHQIINDSFYEPVHTLYAPSNKCMAELYDRMRGACAEEGVKILNVAEYPQQFYVLYSLKTDAAFAYIQFYFDVTSSLSSAFPKSELGVEDVKLQKVIQNL